MKKKSKVSIKRGRATYYSASVKMMARIIGKNPELKRLVSQKRTYRDIWIAIGYPTLLIKGSNKFL